MKKRTAWIFGILVALVLLSIPKLVPLKPDSPDAAVSLSNGDKQPSKKGPDAGGGGAKNIRSSSKAVPVEACIISPQPLSDRLSTTGTILASESVVLKCETAGRVTSLSFVEGGAVAKDQLLVKLSDSDLQAQLQKSRAVLDATRAKESRQKQLYDQQMISPEVFEVAQRDLQLAEADVALINAQIRKTEVRAPFAGKVGLRQISVGTLVGVGTVVADLVAASAFKLEFSIPERVISAIKNGTVVYYTIGASPELAAKVYAIEPHIDESTRTVTVRALCNADSRSLISGAFARVRIEGTVSANALTVPTQALVPGINGASVFRIRSGVVQSVPVTTGVRTETMVEIVQGLSTGDTVAITGIQILRPGAAVKISGIVTGP